MASTYTASSINTTFTNLKTMLSVFNGAGSGVVLRVYRIWALNSQTSAVTGVAVDLSLNIITAASAGTAASVFKHDSLNSNLPAQVTALTGSTITIANTLRVINTDNDEVSVNTNSINELSTLFPLCLIWESGYNDSTVEPLVLREGYGVAIRNDTSTTVGSFDFYIEFTVT